MLMYFICKAVDMAPQPIRCLWSGDNKHLKKKKEKKKEIANESKVNLANLKLAILNILATCGGVNSKVTFLKDQLQDDGLNCTYLWC